MIRRLIALLLMVWALGFIAFAAALPRPGDDTRADAIVVPTGSGGRIERGLAMLDAGVAREMLVTGVDPQVKPGEFVAQFNVPERLMGCCITLGFSALDTRGNARETAQWMEAREFRSLRLVTADWHMRRAALELASQLPDGTTILRDAVRSDVSLWTLFLEYHKFIAAWLLQALA